MRKTIIYFLKYLAIAIILLLGLSAKWYMLHFGATGIEEIIFTLKAPLEGVNNDMILSFLKSVILPIIFLLPAYILAIKFSPKIKLSKNPNTLYLKVDIILLSSLFIFSFSSFMTVYNNLHLKEYTKNQSSNNTIYEDYYVDPKLAHLSFPNNKVNLIHIVLESVETTFASKDSGGVYDYNLIPNLTQMAKDNISFSTSDKITGGFVSYGTGFTTGSMVAQTSGIPLYLSIRGDSCFDSDRFLPGAFSIGDLLKKEGYNQTLLLGSDAKFGGKKDYFTYHGEYEIHDYEYAKENQLIAEDYKVWWGYEDQKLFAFAKDELLKLSQMEKPFNLTMLTADTHFGGGYKCDLCKDEYPEQYYNVISCSDRQVSDFVDWIKEQDFYPNTVVVITGDHNSMDFDCFSDLSDDYIRAPYNCIINAQSKYTAPDLKFRSFYSMDWYPTILGAMGIEIEGERLGLGTNMFSKSPTLMEELGLDYLLDELNKNSEYYNNKLL